MAQIINKISQLINEYYIDPILHDSGYNIVNTVTWAVILGICIFGIVKLLRKMNVRITDRLTASVIPFILAGSSLRVIEDTGTLEPPVSYLFITPNIYFMVFFVTIIFLIIAKLVSKSTRKDFETIFALFGSAWFVVNIAYLLRLEDIVLPWVPVFVISSASILLYIIYFIFNRAGMGIFRNKLNLSILGVHLLDASSTVAGVDFLGYYEKHVVPAFLIDLTGTAMVMYPLKLLIFLPVIYVLDSQFDEDEESRTLKTFLKLVIIMLGLAPACRNTVRMMLGV